MRDTLRKLRQQLARSRTSLRTATARQLMGMLLRVKPHIAGVYLHLSPDLRRRTLEAIAGAALPNRAIRLRKGSLRPGLSLIGYPFAETGMGEAMRSLALSVATTATAFEVVDFKVGEGVRQDDRALEPHLVEHPGRRVNVFCVNADTIAATMQEMGRGATDRRYNIIRPFWELSKLHPDWPAALAGIDEIWAPTRFIRDAFHSAGLERVVHIPVAVESPRAVRARAAFGIPDGATAFLFAFSFWSYPARKNPHAVIDAYRQAFAMDPAAPVSLVIKTMGDSPHRPRILAEIAEMTRRDPRIILIDRMLTRQQMHALTASIDVFVSLHRSEGFGLGIAEAMALGKAVIATDYSGSADFVHASRGVPVPYRLIEVRRDDYPYYIEGQHWADPDIGAAAAAMRELAQNTALRERIGASARAFIAEAHSPAAVGAIIKDRLAALDLL